MAQPIASPRQMATDPGIQLAAGVLIGAKHNTDASFTVIITGQPILHQSRSGHLREAADETRGVKFAHHPPHRPYVLGRH